jgi:hypothetical protein
MIDNCGLVRGRLRTEQSLGHHADNVIIPLDLTQLFCPGFMLAAGPPSGFTTDIVICKGGGGPVESLQSHCIHTPTGPVVHPFASHHEGPEINPQGGTYVKPGFSCYRCLATFRPAGFFTFFFSGAATKWSRNCFPTWRGGFCTPGTGGTFTASTKTRYSSCQWALLKRLDL